LARETSAGIVRSFASTGGESVLALAVSSTEIRDDAFLADRVAALARAYAESQTFVSLLAHELRTMLRITERTLAKADGPDLDAARKSTRQILELSETLLDLARGAGDEETDGQLAALRALGRLRLDIERLKADVVVDNLPAVALPAGLLETVFQILVTNALEAGASMVEIGARPDGTITVTDDGHGVPTAEAGRIFGVFSGKSSGAGLGLSLCREILRRRGGDIWLELPSTFAFRVS
jgi:signal transduction histidine kinase